MKKSLLLLVSIFSLLSHGQNIKKSGEVTKIKTGMNSRNIDPTRIVMDGELPSKKKRTSIIR